MYPPVIRTNDKNKISKLMTDLEKNKTPEGQKILRRFHVYNETNVPEIRYHSRCQVTFSRDTSETSCSNVSDKIFFIGQYILKNPEVKQFNLTKIFEEYNISSSYTLKESLKIFFSNSMVYHSKWGINGSSYLSCNDIICEGLNRLVVDDNNFANVRSVVNDIKNELNSLNLKSNEYPNPAKFLGCIDAQIPPTLKLFVQLLGENDKHPQRRSANEERKPRKISGLCHAIMQYIKPYAINPLMLALGVLLYRKYGSKDLPEILSSLGLCCSYYDIQLLEASIILCEEQPMYNEPYLQYVFDNCDHNTATIDGLNSFHCMGGIAIFTPYSSVSYDFTIKKQKRLPNSNDLPNKGTLQLETYNPPMESKGLQSIIVKDLLTENKINMEIKFDEIDFFFLFCHHASNFNFQGFKAYMTDLYGYESYVKSRIICLPFVHNPPTDYDTIFTVLSYTQKKCIEFKQKKIVVSFDQSLYIKAREIIAKYSNTSELDRVIVRLGGFHLIMSFMGAIGYIMNGSGIKSILSLIYAPNSTDNILDGHFYNRAIRAYILLNTALANHLLKNMLACSLINQADVEFMVNILNNDTNISLEKIKEITSDYRFIKVHNAFNAFLDQVEKRGPTAKLWIQFFRMTTLLKDFEQADKSGNWALHIRTIQKMIPFFHASGHNNYAESAHLYLQDLFQLTSELDEQEFASFITNGYFTIRRSDPPCCGLYTDQTIEQFLMKSLKSRKGGIIPRGLFQSVISKWIGSFVGLSDIISSLIDYCNVDLSKSEQHVESKKSSIEINKKHLLILCEYFEKNEPFPNFPYVMCLETGLKGNDTIDCHLAYKKGQEVLNRVTGCYFSELHLKKRVRPLIWMSSALKVDNETIPVDPNLVFQRIAFSKDKTVGLQTYIDYELAPFPSALFDGIGFRKTQKSKFYAAFTPVENINLSSNILSVLDVGYILHRVSWKRSESFPTICKKYCDFVKLYKPCILVADGYPCEEDGYTNSTKLYERLRRSSKYHSSDMSFLSDADKACGVSQEDFLSNINNKKLLIQKLSHIFNQDGIEFLQAPEDADVLIVTTAIDKTTEYDEVQIIGEDIDLLVLMTQYGREKNNLYLNKYDRSKKTCIRYNTNSFKYPNLSPIISFLHAFSGCDTTSAIFGKGKEKILKIFEHDVELINRVQAFYQQQVNPDDLWQIALDIISKMYVKKIVPRNKFNLIRLDCFNKLTSEIKINKLPPTDLAVKQHAMRVYLQCQHWDLNKLNPTEWGWHLEDKILVPTYTTIPLVPEKFIKKFRCTCTSGCNKKACTCKKLGLTCSIFCKNCHGIDCHNREKSMTLDIGDEEEVDYDEEDHFIPIEPEVLLNCTEDYEAMDEMCDISEHQISTDQDDEAENTGDECDEDGYDENEMPEDSDNDDEESDIYNSKRQRLG